MSSKTIGSVTSVVILEHTHSKDISKPARVPACGNQESITKPCMAPHNGCNSMCSGHACNMPRLVQPPCSHSSEISADAILQSHQVTRLASAM